MATFLPLQLFRPFQDARATVVEEIIPPITIKACNPATEAGCSTHRVFLVKMVDDKLLPQKKEENMIIHLDIGLKVYLEAVSLNVLYDSCWG